MKRNTHALLKQYHGEPDYGELAKFASGLQHLSDEQILAEVAKRFGDREYLGILENPAPVNLFGTVGDHIPQNAYEQMMMALSIPVAIGGAMMPDAHHGYSVPIGAVVALDGAISPAFVGFDISCMVMLTIFEGDKSELTKHRASLANSLLANTAFGVGSKLDTPPDHEVMSDPAWNENNVLKALQPLAAQQLGSSGGGNHFADLVIGDFVENGEFFALMTHSGSRGVGHKIATHYTKLADAETKRIARGIPKGYGWLDMNKDSGREYWEAMQLMGRYALANHEIIHDSFASHAGLKRVDRTWNRHNFVWDNERGFVHRKGATPAAKGQWGIIPGTSGTNSYLVRGLGNHLSYESSSHGAGRPYSRTEAKKRHDAERIDKHMEENGILTYGLAADETFAAYKDIEKVIDLQDGILLEKVAVMQPKVVIMGGN